MSIIFKLEDNKTIKIEIEDLKDPIFGGQGRIYFYRDYLLKVLPLDDDTESIPRRFKTLKKVCANLNDEIKKFIVYRGIPLSISVDFKNYFNFRTTDKAILLLFNFLDGEDLFNFLKDELPLSQKRINVYRKLIDILIAVNSVGIIHGDLYPDNFLVDKNEDVYILDLEGAGILIDRKEWEWKPLVIGKESLFPLPPEVKFKNEFTIYSDVWTGVYLLFFILTGIKPLDFMLRNDHKYLQSIIPSINKSKNSWPPELPVNSIREQRKYADFHSFYSSLFKKKKLSEILINTYIKGYLDYTYRPKFEEIKEAIDYELNIQHYQTLLDQRILNPVIENVPDKHVLSNTDLSIIEEKDLLQKMEGQKKEQDQKSEKTEKVEQNKIDLSELDKSDDKKYRFQNYINNLPVSTREYLNNIISSLKNEKLYGEEIEKAIEELIKMKHTEIIVNTFIKTKDIHLVALFLKFIYAGYWQNLLDSLYALSNVSNLGVYRIIEQKVLPIIVKTRRKSENILDNYKEIFEHIYSSINKEISFYSSKKAEIVSNYLLVTFCFLSFIVPFVMFYFFKMSYVSMILIYPFLLILFLIVFRMVFIFV
ncbi:MAG: protein kinase [Candidatus Calescibacterium sp.]|nr:protein kinase [Candidatus Calescibacterium sp.]MDW8132197.1 protein kinase [Candidatus Calescibacterium sp.]